MKRRPEGTSGGRRVFLARATLFIERLAPILIVAGAPLALLVIVSLFDLWGTTPRLAHALALAAAFALSASIAWRMRRSDLSSTRDEALARLERDGGVRHDALRALEDAPSTGGGALWEAHLADMRARARAARLNAPAMTANAVDPFGFRYAALALTAIGFIAAGENAGERLLAGFLPGDPRAGAAGFADLWIEPPAYTGKAPIYLLRARDTLPGMRDQIDAPEGSIVHAQVNSKSRFRLSMKTPLTTVNGEREGPENASRAMLTLSEPGVLTLSAGGRAGRWPLGVIDDRTPGVEFVEPPAADDDGRLAFTVRIDDDYGATSASLRLRLDPDQERPLDAPAIGAEAKNESRLVALDGFAGAVGLRDVSLALDADPWAGMTVIAAVIVTDAAGQTGETAALSVTLPAKTFFNPLARAVIEQRQTLSVAPSEWRRAEWAFNGLTLGPEYFFEKPTDYLLLRTAMWRVTKEAGGDFKDTVDEFWPLALQLEDEALELARRRLEAAKDALRDALENGASDDEINRLTEELRAALEQYLQALAQSGAQPDEGPPADETLSAGDLQSMIDSIRDLARSGAQSAARQALDDLENLLNNLRLSGRSGGGDSGAPAPLSGPTGQAGDLIGRQRELADQSFERGQTRGAPGGDLAEEESGLAGDVSELMRSLEEREGADPDGGAGRALGRALNDMRRAEDALRGGDFDGANEAMERAIGNLRDGAETLARAQAAQAEEGRGERGGARAMRDPLGRPVGEAYGDGVEVPEKSDAQRTRELIEELRRRLADGERTEDEIEYLERLLKRF
ncbi:MAG: DUF4175 domain-containing protein [Parvularculaceae bacterium]